MSQIFAGILIVLFAAFSRLMPHPANFAPIVAIALFSGVYFNKRIAFIIPFAAMLLSDLFIGFHQTMIWVYVSFALITVIGLWLKDHKKAGYILGGTVTSSVLFFIITNFGMWTTGYYGYTMQGLAQCYTMAIPFFRNQLAGDFIYTAMMFGMYELIRRYAFSNSVAEVKVKNQNS
jgi:hypothetical protein